MKLPDWPFQMLSRFLAVSTAKPWVTIAFSVVLILGMGFGLTKIVKDTSVDAFIPNDHHSLQAKEKAKALFGLNDPVIVAVVTDKKNGIYTPQLLTLMHELQSSLGTVANVREDRFTSILSENAIYGLDDELLVEPIVGEPPYSDADAELAKQLVYTVPPYVGTLVSADGAAALISIELADHSVADQTYQAIADLVGGFAGRGATLHVAGQGAVAGYLSKYIDKDSRKMQPLMVLVILLILATAFMRIRALLGPLLVIVASAGGAIGIMAWVGVPYYAITSALPVVIVSIAVADSIHVLTAYYEVRANAPTGDRRAAVIAAMKDMFTPVTLTTLTTTAGFVGLSAASIMPPIKYFGMFAAVGVLLAWAFTMLLLPSAILILKLDQSPVVKPASDNMGLLPRMLTQAASAAAIYPFRTLAVVLVLTATCVQLATSLRIDRAQVENFHADEPIRIADQVINEKFAGTSYLDVIIESNQPDGLLDGEVMRKVADLQAFMERLPYVTRTVSIADYVALMHGAVMGEDAAARLPESGSGVAQYLLLYEASGDPTDFQEEIDQEYRVLHVRGYMNSHYFSQETTAVEALQDYIEREFQDRDLTATISGRVNIRYHWMTNLASSHFLSVIIALTLVCVASGFLFGSMVVGILATVPVFLTTLGIYALMALSDIHLEPATSMFAAISIGVGVDFAIHLIDRLKLGRESGDGPLLRIIERRFPYAARACFFNAAALGIGFCVPIVSELPTLQRFGMLVAFACLISFLSALVIVPMAWSFAERWRAHRNDRHISHEVSQ